MCLCKRGKACAMMARCCFWHLLPIYLPLQSLHLDNCCFSRTCPFLLQQQLFQCSVSLLLSLSSPVQTNNFGKRVRVEQVEKRPMQMTPSLSKCTHLVRESMVGHLDGVGVFKKLFLYETFICFYTNNSQTVGGRLK